MSVISSFRVNGYTPVYHYTLTAVTCVCVTATQM